MRKHYLRNIAVSLLASFVLFAFTDRPDHANFSGEWKLNEGKSDLGQFANFAVRTLKAEQKDDSITIYRTAPSFTGDNYTTTETLSYDGKETESSLFGNSKKKASSKWSDDGQVLNITYTLSLDFNGQTTEVTGKEKWVLSDGGKTLTLENNSTSSFGDLATKSVYEKQ